jgi:hypothetical protein
MAGSRAHRHGDRSPFLLANAERLVLARSTVEILLRLAQITG